MSRRIAACFAIAATLALSGCAFLDSLNGNLDHQVDVWMKQHEYARILDTLQYISPSNPQYRLLQKKRQQALAESKRYEQIQIKRALNLMEKGQWYDAELTLNDAMDKLPESKTLDKTYQDFSKARDAHLKNLYCLLYRNKAGWLLAIQPLEGQLNKTQPDDNKVQQSLSDFDDDKNQVYDGLLDCGQNAASNDNPDLALDIYQLAKKLKPGKQIETKIATLEKSIERKRGIAQKSNGKAISPLGQNLLDKSKKALAAGDLKLALHHYESIPDADKQLPPVVKYDTSMNRRIRDNVHQGLELGRKLYSQGQVEQALAVWKKLRDLDPDNENLLSHIDRAERVLEKVQQLRKEQTPSAATQTGGNNN